MSNQQTTTGPTLTQPTGREAELTALSEFVAGVMGWTEDETQPGTWKRQKAEGEKPETAWRSGGGCPDYARDERWYFDMVRWLNGKGFVVSVTQRSRGGYSAPTTIHFLVNADADNALMEKAHGDNFYASRTQEMCTACVFCIGDAPYQALCAIIKELVERFPELRNPVESGGAR